MEIHDQVNKPFWVMFLAIIAGWGGMAQAGTYDWSGATNANMSGTVGNWGGTVPGSSDVARWNAPSYQNSPTANANMSIGQLLFDAGNTAGVAFGSGTSTLTNNGIVGVGVQVNYGSGAVNTGSAKFALGASQTWVNNSGNVLTINGTINLSAFTLTLNGSGAASLGGVISGAGGCLAISNGTITLSAANTYTGTTTIHAGTLALSAGSLATSNLILMAGATLDVSALTSGYSVPSGKMLSCGSTSGAAGINASGKTLTLVSGAWAAFQANGVVDTVGKISVTGNLTLNANAITINITGAGLAAGTYRLMDCDGTLSNTGVFGVPTITGTPLEPGYAATILVTTGTGGHVDLVIGCNRFSGSSFDGYDNRAATSQGIPQPIINVLGINSAALVDGDAASDAKGTAFGTCVTNVAVTNWFAITNSGVADLSITIPVMIGEGAPNFKLGGMPTSLLAGAESNFWISFVPTTVGLHTALVSIANSSTTTPFRINIAGVGTGGTLSPGTIGLSPAALDFMVTYLGGSPSDQVFSVNNTGQSSFGYTNTTAYAAGAAGWFSVIGATGYVTAGASQIHTVQVSSAGLSPGTYFATNTVSSHDADNSPQDLIVTLTVAKATPSITWANPAVIAYGTPLSGVQLNASVSPVQAGTLVYNPPAGTLLNPGTNQVLQVVLNPTDSLLYNTVTSQVAISVNPVIVAKAGMSGTIVPSGTVVVPFGGSTNFVVTASDLRYGVGSLVSNGVVVAAAAGLQVFTSKWQSVTSTGSIAALFNVNLFVGGGYDGYGQNPVLNVRLYSVGSVYKIR